MKLTVNQKKTLTHIAYEAIKKSILDGSIPPGVALSEKDFAGQLGISRTPVREALRILESQDLVEIKDGVGTFVKSISLSEARDLFEARAHLEAIIIATAINHITENDLKHFEVKFDDMLNRYRQGETITNTEFLTTDSDFHHMILEKSTNKYIKNFARMVFDNTTKIEFLSPQTNHDVEKAIALHKEFIALIRSKDVEALKSQLSQHSIWAYNRLDFLTMDMGIM